MNQNHYTKQYWHLASITLQAQFILLHFLQLITSVIMLISIANFIIYGKY